MQTKARKIIKRLEREAKRTQKQTWRDMEALLEIVQEAGCAQRDKSSFYRNAMRAILDIRWLGRKTRENAIFWTEADATVQRLLQVERGRK